jgi:hypothetical protein
MTLVQHSRAQTYSKFEDLPSTHRESLDAIATSDFHATIAWYENFVQSALTSEDCVRLYCVEQLEPVRRLIALLPMQHHTSCSIFDPRALCSLTNYYTCLFEPLLTVGAELKRCVQQIAAVMREERPRWDVVRFSPLAPEHPFFEELRNALRGIGFATQDFYCFGNWYLPVEGRSFGDYISARPSALQNTLRRKAKKLDQSGRARIEIVTTKANVDKAIGDYRSVYDRSWKVPEPFPNFIPGLIRVCAERGWLRLGFVFMDGIPIASQLWVVHGAVASIYKLAYDKNFASWSAGTILTARMIEHALDVDRVREIDYLSGDDDYKKSWMSHRRERRGLIGFNRHTVKGILTMARHIGGRTLKRAYQRFR